MKRDTPELLAYGPVVLTPSASISRVIGRPGGYRRPCCDTEWIGKVRRGLR